MSTVNKMKKKLKKGLTLIEAAMVLAISTLVVAGVMVFFQSASTNSKTNETMAQIGEMAGIVRSLYSNSPTYAGLSTNALIMSNSLPNKMINGSSVYHAFNGTVSVTPANYGTGGSNNTFYMQLNNIPAEACAKMAPMDMGRGVVTLRIGSTNVALPTNPVTAATACGRSGNTSMRWQFQ